MIYLPLAVCIIGAFIFAITDNPKVSALAQDSFWCGLLITLWTFSAKTV